MISRRNLFKGALALGTVVALHTEAIRVAFGSRPQYLIRALPHPSLPVGLIAAYVGQSIPDGWLVARGQWVAPYLFPELFEVVGHTYGYSPTLYAFRLPDLRARPSALLGHDTPDHGTRSYRRDWTQST